MLFARLYQIGAVASAALLLVACGGSNGGTREAAPSALPPVADNPAKPPATEPPAESPEGNQPPQISGTAPLQATVGQQWAFQPNVSDPDGDALTVSATSLPGWLGIDPATGRLAGTPSDTDVQTWTGISLRASDGSSSASLPPFAISVLPANVATGTATLSWLPPTQTTEGRPIGQIAGYRLLYGQISGDYTQVVELDNPGITRYMIEGLTPGDWYFAIQTVDGTGRVSSPSAEARKTI